MNDATRYTAAIRTPTTSRWPQIAVALLPLVTALLVVCGLGTCGSACLALSCLDGEACHRDHELKVVLGLVAIVGAGVVRARLARHVA